VIYDILRLSLPPWTDDFAKTLRGVHVTAEVYKSKRITPSVRHINLIDSYLAIVLTAMLDMDLTDVLVRVLISTKVLCTISILEHVLTSLLNRGGLLSSMRWK
jgi:hypothetical protein